jgi:hypothetical protein
MAGHATDRQMIHQDSPARDSAHPPIYQIRIQGHLDPQWADWFAGLSITQSKGVDVAQWDKRALATAS